MNCDVDFLISESKNSEKVCEEGQPIKNVSESKSEPNAKTSCIYTEIIEFIQYG